MTKLTSLPQAAPHSATELVFDTIYEAVVRLKLPPGTRVSEAKVAEQLGVSRQPVRDAFFRLANRGFLLIRPQRATLVTRISEAKVCRAAFIRIALETACIKAVIERVTEAQLSELHALLRAQGDVVAREDREAFHLLDEAFHERLCDIAGQSKVWYLIREQKGHMDRARFLSLSFNQSSAHAEHAQILTAIKARDLISASERLEAHLTKIRSHLAQIRLAHSAYFEEER